MDGFELLAERQKDERLRQMPALVPAAAICARTIIAD
jgi:hypothetical protein